jgi:hypothetical protein
MNVPIGFVLKEKVASLQQALLDKHPSMPTLLQEIHKAIQQQPEQVTLLAPEEIAIIVSGLEKQTGVELARVTVSSSKSKSQSLAKKLSNADLLDSL